MRRLVIDDERDFGPDFDYARNIDQAQKMLAQYSWDEVWLDNDLGGDEEVRHLIDELERAWFEDLVTLDIALFVIHTANPIARDMMIRTFEKMPYSFVVVNPLSFRVIGGRMMK